jgi:hypothetical protein
MTRKNFAGIAQLRELRSSRPIAREDGRKRPGVVAGANPAPRSTFPIVDPIDLAAAAIASAATLALAGEIARALRRLLPNGAAAAGFHRGDKTAAIRRQRRRNPLRGDAKGTA